MTDKPKSDLTFVRAIYGKGANAKAQYEYIPDGGMNKIIEDWQNNQPDRPITVASPSKLLDCPRAVWLEKHGVPVTNEKTWALKQRMLLGRLFENQFAVQLKDQGLLLHHWKDDPGVPVEKFTIGEGLERLEGVPDYLMLKSIGKPGDDSVIAVSDAKTSRSDSFGYVGITEEEIFADWGWYKYRIQLTAYHMLCYANTKWFVDRNLDLPSHCHLFSYALDDGVVRREVTWVPTEKDKQGVLRLTKRYNEAVNSPTMPDCTCHESFDQFDVKFCKYGLKPQGSKIAESCCNQELAKGIEATSSG